MLFSRLLRMEKGRFCAFITCLAYFIMICLVARNALFFGSTYLLHSLTCALQLFLPRSPNSPNMVLRYFLIVTMSRCIGSRFVAYKHFAKSHFQIQTFLSLFILRDFVTFLEISGDFVMTLELVRRNDIFHTHVKFQVCSSSQFLNQLGTNKKSLSFNIRIRFIF